MFICISTVPLVILTALIQRHCNPHPKQPDLILHVERCDVSFILCGSNNSCLLCLALVKRTNYFNIGSEKKEGRTVTISIRVGNDDLSRLLQLNRREVMEHANQALFSPSLCSLHIIQWCDTCSRFKVSVSCYGFICSQSYSCSGRWDSSEHGARTARKGRHTAFKVNQCTRILCWLLLVLRLNQALWVCSGTTKYQAHPYLVI